MAMSMMRPFDRYGALALAALSVVASLALPAEASATVFGLKSTGSVGSGSTSPTVLFSFEETGAAVAIIDNVTVADSQIDADALALSAAHGLLAFRIAGSDSQLIAIDPATAVATAIGSPLGGRNIRAAGFDLSQRLWVIDAAASDLLEVNPSTGAVIGSPINLSLGGGDFVITSEGSDLAFRSDGVAIVVSSNSVYSLDVATGALTLLFTDEVLQTGDIAIFLVGAAFPAGAAGGDLFVFDVNGDDDVYFYDNAALPRMTYDDAIVGSFNAGRGDLASFAPSLDIDGDGQLAPLTDGLLVLRHQFGFTGTTLIGGAVGMDCTRCDEPAIPAYISALGLTLDIDGDGQLEPLTDGLLVLRYLFGFTGTTLTTGAVGLGCTRCDADAITPYLQGLS
jgi:hypothetical protein